MTLGAVQAEVDLGDKGVAERAWPQWHQLTVPLGVDLDAVLDSIGNLAVSFGITLHVEDLTGDESPD